jgi:hypothetical protein
MLRSRRRWFHISPIFLSFPLFFFLSCSDRSEKILFLAIARWQKVRLNERRARWSVFACIV